MAVKNVKNKASLLPPTDILEGHLWLFSIQGGPQPPTGGATCSGSVLIGHSWRGGWSQWQKHGQGREDEVNRLGILAHWVNGCG